MPSCGIFHEGYALALYSLCDNGCRHALCLTGFLEGCPDLVEIVAIDVDYVEIECLKLLVDWVW